MWPTVIVDQAAWSVYLSVTVVSPAKTAQPIQMPFGLRNWVGPVICAKTAELIKMPFGFWAWMGPMNHVLDGSPDPWEGSILGERGANCKA